MNRIKYLYAAACLAPCAFAAEELSTTGDMLDGIAAIVNEGVVLKSELAVQTEAANAQGAKHAAGAQGNDQPGQQG